MNATIVFPSPTPVLNGREHAPSNDADYSFESSKQAFQPNVLAFVWLMCFLVTAALAQPATNCVQCPSGLIAWWPGEGTTNLAGSGNGTLQNGATNAPGLVGDAFSLDGSDDRVEIPESHATDLSRQPRWTIVAWVKPTSFTSKSYSTVYSEGYWGISLGVHNPSGKLESWISNNNQLIGTISVQLSNWNHVALTYDGTNRVFYVNGGFAGSGSAPWVTPDNGGAAIGDVAPTHAAAQFQGMIDEVAVFNRALSSDEIAGIYAAGTNGMCQDALPPTILSSPTNQFVALGSNVTLTVTASGTPPLGYHWRFNGTNLTDSARINGSQSNNLIISNLLSNDAGSYQVVVTNPYGSIASAFASLTIFNVPGSDTLYVGSWNRITQFAPDGTPTVIATVLDPWGLAFDRSGNLYVANDADNTIVKIAPDRTPSLFATGVSVPTGLAFDRSGNLYAANYYANTITKFAPDGTPSLFADSGLSGPSGLAFDRSGNLYVANYFSSTITKIAPDGTSSLFANTSVPTGLAFDRNGNLYAANRAAYTITKFSPDGTSSLFVGSGLSGPFGLAFDSSGNLYVANYNGNKINKFDAAGNSLGVYASTGLNGPVGIAFAAPLQQGPWVELRTPTDRFLVHGMVSLDWLAYTGAGEPGYVDVFVDEEGRTTALGVHMPTGRTRSA